MAAAAAPDVAAAMAPAVAALRGSRLEVRWEAYPSPYGAPYYHNPATGESRWTLPTGPYDVVVLPDVPTNVDEKGNAPAEAAVESTVPASEASLSPSSSSSSSCDSDGEHGSASGTIDTLRTMNARLEGFRTLLKEKCIKPFDKYETWLPKLLSDPRFVAVPPAERRQLFACEARRLGERQRRNTEGLRQRNCKAFEGLLASAKERGLLSRALTAEQALATIADSDLGRDVRWGHTAPSDRARIVAASLDEDLRRRQEETIVACRAFGEMVQERVLRPGAAAGAAAEPPPSWPKARRSLRDDPRYQAVDSAAVRERLYGELAAEAERRWLQMKRRQADDDDELAHRRKRSRRTESEAEFRRLLEERVKNPLDFSWAEVRVLLHGTEGSTPADLDEASREGVFNELRRSENTRRLGAFADALRKLPPDVVGPQASFEEALGAVLGSLAGGKARLQGVPDADIRRAWEDWRRAALAEAAEAFKLWLRQCEHLCEVADDPEAHFGHGQAFELLCKKLEANKLYQRLDRVPGERRKLIAKRLREAAAERAAGHAATSVDDDSEG